MLKALQISNRVTATLTVSLGRAMRSINILMIQEKAVSGILQKLNLRLSQGTDSYLFKELHILLKHLRRIFAFELRLQGVRVKIIVL